MSASIREIDMYLRASSAPSYLRAASSAPSRDFARMRVLFRAVAATAAGVAASVWLAGCATDRLEAAPPKGVDFTGQWQLDPNLSDDPTKPPLNDSASPSEMRHRSGRGRGSVGLPPFGNPAGAGGPTGGAEPDGTEDLTGNPAGIGGIAERSAGIAGAMAGIAGAMAGSGASPTGASPTGASPTAASPIANLNGA